jgi:formamidopyrimidine-DNA glycosylase
MPELPDITVYLEALQRLVVGQPLEAIRVASPSLLRTADPPIQAAEARTVVGARRIGKRIALALDGDLFLVVHLMIAGRFHWRRRGARLQAKITHAAFDFPNGTLVLTEASSRKRASLHLVRGEEALRQFDPGGVEPLEVDLAAFRAALTRENRTLKRALTDPTVFSGIGNAYSDEILHRARLSLARLTRSLDDGETARLFEATRSTLAEWIERLRAEAGDGFPERVTAFRKDMAVHGRYRQPCPVCGTPVQRIVYAENECNYCPTCQTGGRLLADRALSRLLGEARPRTLEELERITIRHRARRQ